MITETSSIYVPFNLFLIRNEGVGDRNWLESRHNLLGTMTYKEASHANLKQGRRPKFKVREGNFWAHTIAWTELLVYNVA